MLSIILTPSSAISQLLKNCQTLQQFLSPLYVVQADSAVGMFFYYFHRVVEQIFDLQILALSIEVICNVVKHQRYSLVRTDKWARCLTFDIQPLHAAHTLPVVPPFSPDVGMVCPPDTEQFCSSWSPRLRTSIGILSTRVSKWGSGSARAVSGPTMFPRDVSATTSFKLTSVPKGSCQFILLFNRVIWSDPVVNLSIKSVLPVSSPLVSSSFPYPPCLSLFKSLTSFWRSSLSGLSRK